MTSNAPPTVAIKTLGCKLNQFESQQMREQFLRRGCEIVPFGQPADIHIINTCTVTHRTDSNCRRLIRKAKRENPGTFVVATGCYAEMQPEVLRDIPAADLVVGNAGKANIAGLIQDRSGDDFDWQSGASQLQPQQYSLDGRMITDFCQHTRAFMKVQDGCDARCAYCIICKARGASESANSSDVLEQTKSLLDAGHPEIVLIGTHLGQYGKDLQENIDLTGLLQMLCELPRLQRLRLSSIEPREVPPKLIDYVANHPKVCRHLHLPMQHGADSVLRRMNRPYTAEFYADLVNRIKCAAPYTCLGADVMVGFPGETQQEFEQTYELVQRLPLSYLHVFTYSPREGTPAAEMDGQIPHPVKIERNHALKELSAQKRAQFAETMIDRVASVVFERPVRHRPALIDGITDNYLRAHVPASHTLCGTLQQVKVVGASDATLQGHILDSDKSTS